jgi:exodeoxyribonuclease VII small subunit
MSKPARAAANAADEMPFQEALQKLETIVEAMESGDLPLETMLARFEEGTKLARQCQAKLEEAEIKIQQLEKNAAGEFSLKPLEEAGGTA